MSWLVRGTGKRPDNHEAMVFEREGQYIPDAERLLKEAIRAGCTEIFIIKKGKRNGKEIKDRSDYLDRVRRDFSVGREPVDG